MDFDVTATVQAFFQDCPIFFNEADMLNQFARYVVNQNPEAGIFMEVSHHMPLDIAGVETNRSISFDLIITIGERVILFEMKYKTAIQIQAHHGITYRLKNQGSQNLTRYDVWHDLERCEFAIGQNIPLIPAPVTESYVLLYTNDHLLWGAAVNNMSVDLPLDGGIKVAMLRRLHSPNDHDDLPAVGSVGVFRRNHIINVQNEYIFFWHDSFYDFQYLLVQALQPNVVAE